MADYTDIAAAAAALEDPATSATDLMQIAQAHQRLWVQVAGHPAAYQGLLDWLATYGGPEVKQAVELRNNPAVEEYEPEHSTAEFAAVDDVDYQPEHADPTPELQPEPEPDPYATTVRPILSQTPPTAVYPAAVPPVAETPAAPQSVPGMPWMKPKGAAPAQSAQQSAQPVAGPQSNQGWYGQQQATPSQGAVGPSYGYQQAGYPGAQQYYPGQYQYAAQGPGLYLGYGPSTKTTWLMLAIGLAVVDILRRVLVQAIDWSDYAIPNVLSVVIQLVALGLVVAVAPAPARMKGPAAGFFGGYILMCAISNLGGFSSIYRVDFYVGDIGVIGCLVEAVFLALLAAGWIALRGRPSIAFVAVAATIIFSPAMQALWSSALGPMLYDLDGPAYIAVVSILGCLVYNAIPVASIGFLAAALTPVATRAYLNTKPR
ncbi:MAG: hypothetical protein LBR58_08825 [Propionibacteriaceae bacterium]|jgi:hypothetical protein|nr:hypothetical protein [Propionibacteriaceae bacterium]